MARFAPDNNLANSQMKELIDAFDAFDADHSGEIDADELKSVLKALDLDCVDDEVNALMNAMDRNGDGTIQFYEFAKMMGSKFYVKKSKSDLLAAFQKYDRDNSGQITVDELYHAMKEFRGNLTKKEVQEMVKKVDKDGNNKINIAEFIALMSL